MSAKVFQAARDLSANLKEMACTAADERCLEVTGEKASDHRAALLAETEQRHADRLAALARHFGQHYRGPGDPDAGHALAFLAEIDPAKLWAPGASMPLPIGEITTIEFAGTKQQRRVDGRGRAVPESPVADDGWSNRPTFAADAEAFLAAKRAGVAG